MTQANLTQIVDSDGFRYLIPPGREAEAIAYFEIADRYWDDDRRKGREPPPPLWLRPITGRCAVVVRHEGFVDRFARRDPRDGFEASKVDAWLGGDDIGVWDTDREATQHAETLTKRFGSDGYRFDVCHEARAPRWYFFGRYGVERIKASSGT